MEVGSPILDVIRISILGESVLTRVRKNQPWLTSVRVKNLHRNNNSLVRTGETGVVP